MGTLAVRAESVSFHNLGDEISGTILPAEDGKAYVDQVQTIINTDAPKLDKNGRPLMMPVIKLQTQLRNDGSDDGQRTLYAASVNMQIAIRNAIQATGASDLEIGAWLRVRYASDAQASTPGFTPPKQYEAEYRRPTGSLGGQQQLPQSVRQATGGVVPHTDAVSAARAVQQTVQAAHQQPQLPYGAQPPAAPSASAGAAPPPVNGATTAGDDMAKIRELAGYGLDASAIVAAMNNKYTINAVTAILAIP
jgi:hypothetical protein